MTLRTHCSKNHELTSENVYNAPDGSRSCRQCKRESTIKRVEIKQSEQLDVKHGGMPIQKKLENILDEDKPELLENAIIYLKQENKEKQYVEL